MGEIRETSSGARYKLTPELREHLITMRREIGLSSSQMAEEIGLNSNTYNNIEKNQGSSSITLDILKRFFITYQIKKGQGDREKEDFIIEHLDKYMSEYYNKVQLDKQDWLKALYLQYQTVTISDDNISKIILQYGQLNDLIEQLNKNKHIRIKTKIRKANEVYINLKNSNNDNNNNDNSDNIPNYPNWGGFPFWCIKYDFSPKAKTPPEETPDMILNKLNKKHKIRYSTLFSLLVGAKISNCPVKERNFDCYDMAYSETYMELRDITCEGNIFDKIEDYKRIKPIKKENKEIPLHILKLVSNCINGRDNFINSINVDFSPLYEATPSEIEQFKTELQELINKYDKERTD